MAPPPYDFWLLDLDGTIVDVDPRYIHEVFAEVGDRLGRDLSEAEAERLWYGEDDARERIFPASDVPPERFWEVYHRVEDPVARAEATYVYDDAARIVPRIDEPVGLVTHCQNYLTGPILDHLDIADWFDSVVCCSDETGWKPDPRPVEAAMADLGVAGNGAAGVLVGDGSQDVGAAMNAGLDPVHVRRPNRGHPDGIGSARSVSTLSDLES
jgi:phosphoglycolate phosphatase